MMLIRQLEWARRFSGGVGRGGRAPRKCAPKVFAFDDSRTPRERLPPPSATPTTAPQRSGLAPAGPSTLSAPAPITLTLDRVAALSPAVLTASLAAYADHHNRQADPRLLDAVARRVSSHVEEYGGSDLVAVLQAYSMAGQAGAYRDFLAICCAMLTCKVDELSPTELSRLAVACAALQLSPTDLLTALCSRAGEPEVLSRFSAGGLVELMGGLAQLQHRSPAFFADAADVLATELQAQWPAPGGSGSAVVGGRCAALSPAQAVMAVWAMAAVGLYQRQLFDGTEALLLETRLGGMDGNTLAKVAWSYATVRHLDESHRAVWDRDLFDDIAAVCLDMGVSSFPPRALVTLLWSFASLPHYDAPLFDALCTALAPHLQQQGQEGQQGQAAPSGCSPSDLVAVAWAMQRVGHPHPQLMAALGDAALRCRDSLDGEDLTAIAMAFPAAKSYNRDFFKHLVTEAQARPQLFGQVALLDIIRLVGRVQHREPDFYGPALQVLLDHVHQAFLDAPLERSGCMNPFRFG